MGVLAREDGGSTGTADGVCHEATVKPHAVGANPIHVGRFEQLSFLTIRTDGLARQIVGEDEDNVDHDRVAASLIQTQKRLKRWLSYTGFSNEVIGPIFMQWTEGSDPFKGDLSAVEVVSEITDLTVSPDGRTLIYERWRITSQFVQHTLNDDDQGHAVTIASGHALERGAHLSEDGKRWVFVSSRSGQDQLWIGDSSGATPTQLTHSDADYLETPRWSRDGKSVVFTASHHGQMDVWSVDVANGHLEALTRDGKSKAPSFSRDGHSLYVGSARNGHWQIWRQPWPTNTKNHAEQITQTGGLAAIESADGSLLYYVRHDRKGLWQRSRNPGGDESLLSAELAPLDWRNWDVASDAIWFVARREDSDPMLAKYSFFEGRLLRGPTLPKLLPESGLTLTPDRSSVWLSEIVSTQVDLEKATLSHQTQ
jgi:hypothetical protein